MTKQHSHEPKHPLTANASAPIRPMSDSEQRPEANPAILASGESIEPWADIAVPCYPLQPRRSETQVLPGDERYILSLALAPREQSSFVQNRSRNWVWWVPTPTNMNWFNEAVHEWLVRKRGFRRKDLKSWSFRDLASKIVEVVTDDDRIVTARWRRELRELQHLIEDAVWAPIGAPEWPGPAMASIEDLKTWWSFIRQDLQDCGLLNTNETLGAPGTNAGGQANPYEPLSESIFRNNNWVKLAAFIKSYCEGPLTDRRVESLKNSLQAADRSSEIKLPKCTCSGGGEWTKGKTKYYTVASLARKWAAIARNCRPCPVSGTIALVETAPNCHKSDGDCLRRR